MKNKLIGVFFLLIVFGYIAVFFLIRINNPKQVQLKTYQEWKKEYLVNKGHNQTFVNAGSRKNPIALSEAQGFGLIITTKAAKLGWAKELTLISY